MRRLAVLVLVLGLATAASAELKITVNGVIDPQAPIYVSPSTWLTIGVYSNGMGVPFTNTIEEMSIMGGSYDITGATNTVNPPGYPDSIFELEPGLIIVDLAMLVTPQPLPSGQLVDQILVHPDGPGDMIITLYDMEGIYDTFDTQIIHAPEPATLLLLGLGGLMLRKRS